MTVAVVMIIVGVSWFICCVVTLIIMIHGYRKAPIRDDW